jgi:outer membrane protein assembly factor BamB
MERAAALVIIALVGGALAPPSQGADGWQRFRGPNGSGISQERGLPVEFGPGANLAWAVAAPLGTSSPVVVVGRVFLTGYSNNQLLVW